MPASFSPPDERPVSLPYCEGTVRDKGTLALTGPSSGSPYASANFACESAERKARRLRSPGFTRPQAPFCAAWIGISAGHAPNLICGVMKMSIRINLDLEPEYEAFVKEWADKLGIPLSELMRRVVHETCNGYRYDEKIPDYFPLERRPDWKRLDRRRDRRKKRAAARLN